MVGITLLACTNFTGNRFMKQILTTIAVWFDSWKAKESEDDRIDWVRVFPFVVMHLACLAIFVVGVSPAAVIIAIALYALRMFAITAFYHRYFSHRSFVTSRPIQFLFAALGASSVQRGPLWWAAHHRRHHRYSDESQDSHSPRHGFWHSHLGWFLNRRNLRTRTEEVNELLRYPELVWLDRFDMVVPIFLACLCLLTGTLMEAFAPGLGTNGSQVLVWGFFVSTVILYHATFTINSLAHRLGSQRFPTRDDSRNNFFLALLTFGEGWHNNHHRYPGSVRQGFRWWEIDMTYYLLRMMASVGLVWDLRGVPERLRGRQR
jgi:stearoyl-CoA desaturase (delta-9 desaturase)